MPPPTAPITFVQTNGANRAAQHNVVNPAISPLTSGDMFTQISINGVIREYLFKMQKDGATFWIGVAVPEGTSDFSKVQVFFHPTTRQKDVVVARDDDYPTFTGGWSGQLQRYVAMQGGQHAAARQTPLIVPFTTMGALSRQPGANMFGTRAVETLNAIMTAVRDEVASAGSPTVAGRTRVASSETVPVTVSKIAVTSFSSGVGAMQRFVWAFASSKLIVEVTDFDGPFITSRGNGPQTAVNSPGALSRVFSQIGPGFRQPNWVTMPEARFADITAFPNKSVHNKIGAMTFFMASLSSALR